MTSNEPFTRYIAPVKDLPDQAVAEIETRLRAIKHGLIAVGKLSSDADREAVLDFARKTGWPIFADLASGLRFGPGANEAVGHFDLLLASAKVRQQIRNDFHVDGIVHFGGRLTSKRWYEFVAELKPKEYLMVLNHPLRNDPQHQVTCRVECAAATFGQRIRVPHPQRTDTALNSFLSALSLRAEKEIDGFLQASASLSEPTVARLVSQYIPAGSGLFLANSMPVRDMEMFALARREIVVVTGNRGASGIDGLVASAAGFAEGLQKPVTLMIGDLALLHDLNSLALVGAGQIPLVLVVLNNDGGGIFSFLPAGKFPPLWEPYFASPHGREFSAAAKMFGLAYSRPATKTEFVRAYQKALASGKPALLEVQTSRARNYDEHQALQATVVAALDRQPRKRARR